uniref:F-box domain-containing protein n=1 Tax=Leersia perrieri TaxID=77586 RepID=A0A0D9V5R4_9ORYZ
MQPLDQSPDHGRRCWLSRRRRRESRTSLVNGDGDGGTSLTDDVLAAIFSRLPDAGDVVRCAATCRRWAGVVAKEAGFLSRSLRPPLPGRALGAFFHQAHGDVGRKRKRRCPIAESSTPTCFVPTASGARLLGFNDLFDLSRSRPVAPRNGRVVLELLHSSVDDGDGLELVRV